VVVLAPPPVTYVTRGRTRTSHGFHLAMTILTLGTWFPVWALVTVVHHLHRGTKTVTRPRPR
jgi:hypothetical protein